MLSFTCNFRPAPTRGLHPTTHCCRPSALDSRSCSGPALCTLWSLCPLFHWTAPLVAVIAITGPSVPAHHLRLPSICAAPPHCGSRRSFPDKSIIWSGRWTSGDADIRTSGDADMLNRRDAGQQLNSALAHAPQNIMSTH